MSSKQQQEATVEVTTKTEVVVEVVPVNEEEKNKKESETPQQQKSASNNKNKNKKTAPPRPMTLKEKFGTFLALSYFIGVPITTVTTRQSTPETKDKIDNLYTPPGSILRFAVNSCQFAIRAGLVGVGAVFTGMASLVSGTLVVGGIPGYLWLCSPDSTIQTTLRKPSIPALFGIGIPLGMFGLWPKGYLSGYDKDGNSKFLSHGTTYIYIVSLLLAAGGTFSLKAGDKIDEVVERKQKELEKEEEQESSSSSLASRLVDKAGDAKIGTMEVSSTVDGTQSTTTTSDITVRDALEFAKNVSESKEDKVNRWLKRTDNIFYSISRVCWGTLWGFLARSYFEFMKASLMPIVMSIWRGSCEESDIVAFLLKGFRGMDNNTVARIAAFKAAEAAAKLE